VACLHPRGRGASRSPVSRGRARPRRWPVVLGVAAGSAVSNWARWCGGASSAAAVGRADWWSRAGAWPGEGGLGCGPASLACLARDMTGGSSRGGRGYALRGGALQAGHVLLSGSDGDRAGAHSGSGELAASCARAYPAGPVRGGMALNMTLNVADYKGPCTEADKCVKAKECPLYDACMSVITQRDIRNNVP
jgi:hypothetical protein